MNAKALGARLGELGSFAVVVLTYVALSGSAASARQSNDDEGDDGRVPTTVDEITRLRKQRQRMDERKREQPFQRRG